MPEALQAKLRPLFWVGLLALLSLTQLVFWQDSTDAFAPIETALVKVLVPLCLLPWLFTARAALPGVLASWPVRLSLAWLAWLWTSALMSPFSAEALKTAFEYSLFASLFFLPAACTPKERRTLLAAFLVATLLAAFYGLCQHFGADPWRWSTDFSGRPLGTIGNPDFFGGHLVLGWGLCLGLLLAAPKGRRLWPALAFALLSLVQFYSRTVGAWMGMAFVAAMALLFLLAPAGAWLRGRWGMTRKALALGLAAVVVVVALGASVGPGAQAIARFREEKKLSVVNRTMMWRVALNLWKSAPVAGAGLDSFRPLYPKLQAQILQAEPDKGWNYVVTWLPHENFLYILCETGVIGLLLFCAWWLAATVVGWRKAASGDREAWMALLATAGLAGASLLNTFSNIVPTALGFSFLLGLMAFTPLPMPAAPRRFSLEALVASAVLALVMGSAAGREIAANRFTREAGRKVKLLDWNQAAVLHSRASGLKVLNLSPQSLVGVDFQLGEDLRNLGRVDEAVAAYQADLVANPWAPEVHNMLGAALGQSGTQSGKQDKLKESIGHLATAAWLSPGYTTALLNLGGSKMMLGDKAGAEIAWREVLKFEPGNAQALTYLQMLGKK